MTTFRRYRIKEQLVEYHRVFVVSDTDNKVAFILHYQSDTGGSKLILIDSLGKVLLHIRQISLIHLTFDIYSVDENNHQSLLGVLRRRGPPWHQRFTIESIYGEYKFDRIGKRFHHQYELLEDQQTIAKIKEDDGKLGDLASIDIVESIDRKKDPFLLALVMAKSFL